MQPLNNINLIHIFSFASYFMKALIQQNIIYISNISFQKLLEIN